MNRTEKLKRLEQIKQQLISLNNDIRVYSKEINDYKDMISDINRVNASRRKDALERYNIHISKCQKIIDSRYLKINTLHEEISKI